MMAPETSQIIPGLLPSESRIARLVAKGLLNKEIAFSINSTEASVKQNMFQILKKLGLRNRVELTLRVLSLGVLLVACCMGATVSLSWTASTSSGVVGYEIYRSRYPNGCTTNPQIDCQLLNKTPVACCEASDPSPVVGYTYYYWAAAVGSNGLHSVLSNRAEAVIP